MRKYLFTNFNNPQPQEVTLLELADCGLWTDEEFERCADLAVGATLEFPDFYTVERIE